MLDGLKPYPEYKESGAPWLGVVPAHWNVPRLGAVLRERGENNDDGAIADVLSVRKDRGVIPYADKGNVGNKKSDDITRYKVVRPDDIVVNCMNVIIGSVGISRYTGCLSPVYYVLTRRSVENNPAYLNAYFQTKPFQRSLVRIGNGILAHRMRVPMELLKCEPFPLAPPAEQAGIVRFLGAVDRKVNRFIRAKRRLIEVLTEQKQAIITHAVTKGLNPAAPLKPSGIDWLGDVPEHWEVRKLHTLFGRHGSGTTPSGDAYYGGGVPWVMTGDLKDNLLTCTQRTVTPKALEEVKALRMYPAGSLLVAMYGATIGKTGVLSMDACTNQACCVLAEPRPESNVRFLQAFVIMARPQLVQQSYGGGQPNINSEIVRALRIPLPPRREQDAILDAIAQRTGTIDTAIDRASREIDLIREYRTRLVADVVTGKVDVRAAAAAIPDEDADPGPDPGAGEPGDDADPGTDDADGGADLEPALGAAGTEGEGGEDEA